MSGLSDAWRTVCTRGRASRAALASCRVASSRAQPLADQDTCEAARRPRHRGRVSKFRRRSSFSGVRACWRHYDPRADHNRRRFRSSVFRLRVFPSWTVLPCRTLRAAKAFGASSCRSLRTRGVFALVFAVLLSEVKLAQPCVFECRGPPKAGLVALCGWVDSTRVFRARFFVMRRAVEAATFARPGWKAPFARPGWKAAFG